MTKRYDLSRRHLLGAAAATTATLALPRMAFAAEAADVVIIGAGLSGMHAAELLVEQGLSVIVLEANHRVGGRVETVHTEDGPLDLGASQIGRGYARVLDAIQRYRLQLIPEDRDLLGFGGHMMGQWIDPKTWDANPLNKTVGDERAINPILFGQTVSSKYNPLKEADDWLNPAFAEWDISLRELMTRKAYSPAALDLAQWSVPGIGMDETSMLRMWQEELRGQIDRRVGGGGAPVKPVKNDRPFFEANDHNTIAGLAAINNLVGGTAVLPRAMAAKLGDRIRLDKKVGRIALTDTGGTVTCTDGSEYRGRFVISSLPFTVLRDVAITGSANPVAREAIGKMPYANTARLYLNVTRPFWKDDGLPASFVTDGPLGMFWGIDNHTGEGNHRAMIVLTAQAAMKITRLQHEEAEGFLQEELVKLRPAAKGLIKLRSYKDWAADPMQKGCSYSLAPGQVNGFARDFIKPWQVLHFAGEHTRRLDYGMEAAMESGERAAVEVAGRA